MSISHLIGGREAVVAACAPDVAPKVRHSIAQGATLVVLHNSREKHCPVHGAFREAVIDPAFMPGKTGAHYCVFSPVHGAYHLLGLSHPGSPVNGAGRKPSGVVCEPGVNAGPNTAARMHRERGKPASGGCAQGCRIWPRWGRSARRGYLLTEMLVVISVSSVLAAVAVGLLGTLMRIERAGRRHIEETNGLSRLSKQFRRDVASAEEASIPEENTGGQSEIHLRLAADHVLTYRAEPGVLLRLEEWGQAEAARERFRLPATAEARFDIDDSRSGRLAVLTLDAPRPTDESQEAGQGLVAAKKRRRIVARDGVGRRGWTIEALVARDLRHAASSTGAQSKGEEPAP